MAKNRIGSFFLACGGEQTLTLTARNANGHGPNETYVFQQPYVVIGSCSDCDLVMHDRSVNYRHFYLQQLEGRWYFANLARISRTRAGLGQPATGLFENGCELKIGAQIISRLSDSPQELIRHPAGGLHEAGIESLPFTLAVSSRFRSARETPPKEFTAPMTLIGSSKRCDLILNDQSVSRVHASIVSTPRGLWVVDLVGRGGVLVNGERVIAGEVPDGALLQIGRIAVRVRVGTPQTRVIARVGSRAAATDIPAEIPRQLQQHPTLGGMSEGAVLALVNQIAEMQSQMHSQYLDMQNQFFEHSRMQMLWMSQMVEKITDSHQETARREFARIEEINLELRELRKELAKSRVALPDLSAANPGGRQSGPSGAPMTGVTLPFGMLPKIGPQPQSTSIPTAKVHDGSSHSPTPANSGIVGQVPPPAIGPNVAGQSTNHPKTPGSPPSSPAGSAPQGATSAPRPGDAHVWLTQRMATLSEEQNSLWRRLMKRISGSPDDE